MSLFSAAEREAQCDFPDCTERFDGTKGARVAAIRNGDVVAFCKEDSKKLLSQGVNLRTLQEVHRGYDIMHGKTPEPTKKELQAQREQQHQEFIRSLK